MVNFVLLSESDKQITSNLISPKHLVKSFPLKCRKGKYTHVYIYTYSDILLDSSQTSVITNHLKHLLKNKTIFHQTDIRLLERLRITNMRHEEVLEETFESSDSVISIFMWTYFHNLIIFCSSVSITPTTSQCSQRWEETENMSSVNVKLFVAAGCRADLL